MGEQYQYPNFQVTEGKYIPLYAINGGLPLDRDQALSNDSSISEGSFSSNYLSPPTSPLDNMSYSTTNYVYESHEFSQQQQFDSSPLTGQLLPESVKYTPTLLGWTHNTELVKLYTFIVPKSREPYLQLREKWTPTYETPNRVYLDQPK
jgi:hypothetical protein